MVFLTLLLLIVDNSAKESGIIYFDSNGEKTVLFDFEHDGEVLLLFCRLETSTKSSEDSAK